MQLQPWPYRPTHQTAGLGADFPAVDNFAPAGTTVLAPVSGRLAYSHEIPWDTGKRTGGGTTYLVSTQGVYFLTHFGTVLPSGTTVRAGQPIGTVAAVPGGAWSPHIHEGFHLGAYTVPNTGGGGGGGVGGAIIDAGSSLPGIGPVIGAVAGAGIDVGGAAGHIPGVAQAEAVAGFLGNLTDPGFLLRLLQIMAGAGLAFAGLVLLARQVALAADLPDPLGAVK